MMFDLYSFDLLELWYIQGFDVVREGGFVIDLLINYWVIEMLIFECIIYFGCISFEFRVEVKFKYYDGERFYVMELFVWYYS